MKLENAFSIQTFLTWAWKCNYELLGNSVIYPNALNVMTINLLPRQTVDGGRECYQVRRKSKTRILRTPLSCYHSDKKCTILTLYRSRSDNGPQVAQGCVPWELTHMRWPQKWPKVHAWRWARVHRARPDVDRCFWGEEKEIRVWGGWDFPGGTVDKNHCLPMSGTKVQFPVWEDFHMLQSN